MQSRSKNEKVHLLNINLNLNPNSISFYDDSFFLDPLRPEQSFTLLINRPGHDNDDSVVSILTNNFVYIFIFADFY